MTRVPLTDDHTLEFMRILGHVPELRRKWVEFDSMLATSGTLSPMLKHRVTMALATSADAPCQFCRSLSEPSPADGYDAKEELAVAFAKMAQSDPQGVNEGHFEMLYEEFTVDQVVELCALIGFKLGSLALWGEIFAVRPANDELKQAYDASIAEAQLRWEAGQESSGTLWRQYLEHDDVAARAVS